MSSSPKNSSPPPSQDDYQRAAQAILEADIMVVGVGAGMSADSGLAVYNDVANFPAYHKMNVTYSQLCTPEWLQKDPEIFYGFWGKCYNDYMDISPHQGHAHILRWVQERFSHPLKCGDIEIPNRFFVFSSNVDAHFIKAGFDPNFVQEIHGEATAWHCAQPCEKNPQIFHFPKDFRFDVDLETMRAVLKKIPRCGLCGGFVLPRVLMFGDNLWIGKRKTQYITWSSNVRQIIKTNPDKKLVVLEVGCGKRIPTVREECEEYISDQAKKGNCTFIRINPDFPESPFPEFTISIKSKAKEALQTIHRQILLNKLWYTH